MSQPNIITIDGPSASGKSTLGERLADKLGYIYFDTGLMYRAVTWAALERLGRVDDEDAVSTLAEGLNIDVRLPSVPDGRKSDVWLDDRDITWEVREAVVEANVSQVSTYQRVRTAMTQQQRRIGEHGGVVMVGRDIGTVVMPDAPVKFYLTASVEVRAQRRYDEVRLRGSDSSYESILENLRQRDEIDSNRAIAPLRAAEDAIIINGDHLTIDETVQVALGWISAKS